METLGNEGVAVDEFGGFGGQEGVHEVDDGKYLVADDEVGAVVVDRAELVNNFSSLGYHRYIPLQ